MINIDDIVLEWSYRCNKGYPDINSTSDRLILQNILAEKNVSFDIDSFKVIQPVETPPVVENTEVDTSNTETTFHELSKIFE